MADETGSRALLNAQREQTLRRIEALQRDFDGVVAAAADVATDDEHDPEGATIAFERARVAALLEQGRNHLAAVEHALARLDDGSYGSCERCGEPIAAARLAALPATRLCISCASE